MDWIVGLLILVGGGFAVVAGLGLLRLPDILIRMHAATKVGTLSSGLIMLATALHVGELSIVIRAAAIVIFLLLTAPLAAHMIGRASLRTGVPLYRTSDKRK